MSLLSVGALVHRTARALGHLAATGALSALALGAVVAAPSAARADVLYFAINYGSGNSVSGEMSGTDSGNSFTPTTMLELQLNYGGSSTVAISPGTTGPEAITGITSPLDVTLDGSDEDFYVNFPGGFFYVQNGVPGSGAVNWFGVGGPSPWEASLWTSSLNVPISTPEPASLAVLGLGLGALSIVRRRTARQGLRYQHSAAIDGRHNGRP